jgi:peptidyl-dipeptidase Dcp
MQFIKNLSLHKKPISMNRIKTITFMAIILFAASCKQKEMKSDNPFFAEFDTPFGVPAFDKIKFEHYKPAFEDGMKQQIAEIEAITASKKTPDFKNTIEAFDYSGLMLSRVSRVFFPYAFGQYR